MVAEKAACVLRSEAELLVGTDMGCLMNIAGHLREKGSRIEALHLAQVLDSGHARS
jgi:L-lactate dehydrogenase complex protein LldE